MAWSKVIKGKKLPIRFWYFKIMCEFWYHAGNNRLYYKWLDKITCMGLNLYGEEYRR